MAPASNEGELAIKGFQVSPGLKVDLWAAEPLLANPVAFNFDERGRAYVCECFRINAGVDDIRGIMDWLDEELASRSVDDRLAAMKRHLGDRIAKYSESSERVRLIEDRDGDGKADHATVFAEDFRTALDGIGAGILARRGNVWYANIPNFWLLRDTNHDGVADVRQALHHGYGVRVGFYGHDLHGVHFGPDGKIYFSIGDRGASIKLAGGRHVGDADTGSVFRCNPDGSELEVFATGLRNPQDLVFDQYGNLFTGDNNSDGGDQARWVYLVEGGDSGWRIGYQFMENPYRRGPFNAEKLWYPPFEGQAAYLLPPITNFASGPSGLAYFPGTGLPDRFQDHFFLVDFRGGAANSGIHTFRLKPKGASFEVVAPGRLIWGVLATDVRFGVDGGVYLSDWVQGWGLTGKGRIYRVHDPALDREPIVLATKELLGDGMEKRSLKELARLLAHRDQRVRQEAQFELAARGPQATRTLADVALKHSHPLARIHAIWALGQLSRNAQSSNSNPESAAPLDLLVKLLADEDAEVRSQAAKVLGERGFAKAHDRLAELLDDASLRVRFFAAMSLGKLGRPQSVPAIARMLRENADKDPYLRHAGVMALTWIGDVDALRVMAKDNSSSVRMAVLLAMRRLGCGEIAMFLNDREPRVAVEAARAINDAPINGAMRDLALLINRPLSSEPLLRRVLNANFRLGTRQSAGALAAFAARTEAPESMRVEALSALADWPQPSGRDRVVGLWRPLAHPRLREAAGEALQPWIAELLRSAPDPVRLATLHAAGRLHITNAAPVLSELIADTRLAGEVRAEALKTLAALSAPLLEAGLTAALGDANEELRKAALRMMARVGSPQASAKLMATLENGTLGEKQAALRALGETQDSLADEVLARWLDQLPAGKVPQELHFDLIEAAAKRTAPAVKQKLADYQAARPKDDPLVEYREALFGGDAAQGKKIFFERPETQCVRCHRVQGEGGDVGPDLSRIAAQKDRRFLLESVLLPNKEIAQGFESVTVTLKSGVSYAGVLKRETADELVIHSPEENGLITLKQSDVQARQRALSPMPEAISQTLSRQDLRNLVEYLSSLK